MRCLASVKRLVETFRDLDEVMAACIHNLCLVADKPEKLIPLIYGVDGCSTYVEQLHSFPWASRMRRRTIILHAVDILVDGHGVEPCGKVETHGPPFEYVNMGDPHVCTLVYKKSTDNLFISDWATIAAQVTA